MNFNFQRSCGLTIVFKMSQLISPESVNSNEPVNMRNEETFY